MDREHVLGYLMSVSGRCYKHAVNQRLEAYALTTTQCGVIRTLIRTGEQTQAEIADVLKSDRATIGNVIQKLLEKDYLVKAQRDDDRRAYTVRLTQKAIAIAKDIENISNQIELDALAGLDEAEVKALLKGLNRIIVNLGDSLEAEAAGAAGMGEESV